MLKDKLYSNDRRTRKQRDRGPSGCSVLRFVSRHASCSKQRVFFYMCCISARERNNSLNMANEISILTAIHRTKTRGPPLTTNRNYGEHFCACCHAKFSERKQLELPYKTISLYWEEGGGGIAETKLV